jgi:hypothetical protein
MEHVFIFLAVLDYHHLLSIVLLLPHSSQKGREENRTEQDKRTEPNRREQKRTEQKRRKERERYVCRIV